MPADPRVPVALETEGDRLRVAYARRTDQARYSWFNDAHLCAVQERERHTIDILKRHGLADLRDTRILEVGCGNGFWLREFVKWGAQPSNVTGVEMLPDRVEAATRLAPAGMTIMCGNAARLEVPPASFDIVLQSMVLTSVLDRDVRRAVAQSMLAALRPGGMVLWYDYFVNNPRNPDVRGVPAAEIRELFPGCRVDLRRVTLVAPLARVLVRAGRWPYNLANALPFLRTHYLGAITRA